MTRHQRNYQVFNKDFNKIRTHNYENILYKNY